MKLALVDEAWVAALRIPKGKGDGEVEPPLGDTGAAAGDGAGADDAEALYVFRSFCSRFLKM